MIPANTAPLTGCAIDSCRLCGAGHLEQIYSFGKQPVAGYLELDPSLALGALRLELALVMCPECGLVQQASNEANQLLSGKVYAQYQATYGMSVRVQAYVEDWMQQALVKSAVHPGDMVVEIGSNDGSMLALLRERGFTAVGFEPSTSLGDIASRRGAKVIRDYFGEAAARRFLKDHPPVKLVVTRHTLEHAFDPRDFLRGLFAILAPGGLAVIEVPDLRLQLINNQFQSMTFQHVSFFSVRALSSGLRESGFVPVDVRHVGMDGGSMVMWARKNGRAEPSAAISTSTALEGLSGLDRPSGLEDFFCGVTKFRERSRDLMRFMKAKGIRVIGYGAGSKGQALINMLGLDCDELQYVIDDSPGSAGKYIPGTGIEVLNSNDERTRDAQVIFISAPTHAREIIEKERARRNSDVRYLVTSPDLHFATE